MNVLMPKIWKNMTSGVVVKWLKSIGESVKEGDLLFEIQTERGTTEVESDVSGVLTEILTAAGNKAEVKETIAVISDVNSELSSETAPQPQKQVNIDRDEEEKRRVSPLAQKVAADIGLDLNGIEKSGRVYAQDILEYLKYINEKPQDNVAAAVAEGTSRESVKPMNGMRRAIAKNMLNSHMTSPTVTFNLGIDMTSMKLFREQLKSSGLKVSYTDLLIKFVSRALTEFPALNCSIEDNKIIYKNYVNMGVAVAIPDGLLVPNITDSDKKSIAEISAEVRELADQAREGKLPLERLKGGTFTITNLGMYGIDSFSPIINQPEVAILGVNTLKEMPVVVNGEITIRPIINLSLTADHRVVDGAVAAEFLQRIKALMENPFLLLV